jgi:hypothetical protein
MADGARSHRTGSVEIRGRFFVGADSVMPIRIPDGLPARDALVREGVKSWMNPLPSGRISVPFRIGLLNLMPNKIDRDTDCPADRGDAAAGGTDAGAHRLACGQEHL